jgi:hypothetical protein
MFLSAEVFDQQRIYALAVNVVEWQVSADAKYCISRIFGQLLLKYRHDGSTAF